MLERCFYDVKSDETANGRRMTNDGEERRGEMGRCGSDVGE
jgi:hypothetical protein